MDLLTIGGGLFVVGIIVGLVLYGARKKDAALFGGGAITVLGALMVVASMSGVGFTVSPPTGGGAGEVPVVGEPKTIGTLNIKLQEAESLSWSAADGTLKLYSKETDLSRDSDKTLDTVTITDGNAAKTLSGISTYTEYRGGIDGGSTYYDQDWGVFYFKAPSNVTTSTVDVSVRIPSGDGLSKTITSGLQAVGTIQDIFNEAKLDSKGGDTNYSLNGSNELRYDTGVSNTLDINTTATGTNGQVKLRGDLGCNGSNVVCKSYTFGFDKNADALVEGDEISSFTSQLYTGTDLKLAADLLTAWKNDQGFVLGDVKGGTLGTYDFTIGLNTANITAGADSFKICADDLGSSNNPVDQKDTWLGTKATKNCTTINFVA